MGFRSGRKEKVKKNVSPRNSLRLVLSPSKMDLTIEAQRALHEEIERVQQAIVRALLQIPKTVCCIHHMDRI